MSQTIQRFVALDIHTSYVVVGAVDTRQEVVLHPRRVSLIRLDGWAKKHLKPTDAVVLEATSTFTICSSRWRLVWWWPIHI